MWEISLKPLSFPRFTWIGFFKKKAGYLYLKAMMDYTFIKLWASFGQRSNYAFKPTAVPALGFDRDLSCRAMLST